MATAKTDREIAAALGLSWHTIRGYTKSLYKKLGVHNRTGVVAAMFTPAEHIPYDV